MQKTSMYYVGQSVMVPLANFSKN